MLDSYRNHRRIKKQENSSRSPFSFFIGRRAELPVRRPLSTAAGVLCPFCQGQTISSGRSGVPCENCSYCPRCAMIITEGETGGKCRRCSFLLRPAQPFGDNLGG